MAITLGRVREVRLSHGGELQALIACPPGAVPPPGRYLSAHSPTELDNPLATPLFLAEVAQVGFWAAPPFPPSWIPGTELTLRGPLGTGFSLPGEVTRLALAVLGDSPIRLLPLALAALGRDCAVTLYTDARLPDLPPTLEIYPLDALRESVNWPDFLALDLPLERLQDLRVLLGLHPGDPLPCEAQALIWTPMPCAGISECGACAIPTRRGYKLVCTDGPVFRLDTLDW